MEEPQVTTSHSPIWPSTVIPKPQDSLSPTGSPHDMLWTTSEYGNASTTQILILLNSVTLEIKLAPMGISSRAASFIYATEADVINVAVFGQTAKMWREANPEANGNLRDQATLRQLIVLVNLESMNAELIKLGLDRPERAVRLNKMAIDQLNKLSEDNINQRLLGDNDLPQLPK